MEQTNMQHWAGIGARVTLAEMAVRLAEIIEAVPTARSDARSALLPVLNGTNGHAPKVKLPGAKPKHRGRRMTAAQRKEVSERMSRYWAARRAAEKAGATPEKKAKK